MLKRGSPSKSQTSVNLPSTSSAAAAGGDGENEEEVTNVKIRKATNKYLDGSCSLADFTAALESCDEDEPEPEPTPSTSSQSQEGPSVKRSKMEVVPSTSDAAASQAIVEAAPQESVGYKKDFYHTGDQISTFTLRRKRKISPTIQGLMGEAHLKYVSGEKQNAINICKELIKEEPTLTDPYALLSLIYEDMNEREWSLKFGLIGAVLDPKHCKEWPRLAELSLELGNTKQAISCLNHAIIVNPSVTSYHYKRCSLMRKNGDIKGAIKGYQRMIQTFHKDGKLCVIAYRRIAWLHYEDKDKDKDEKAYATLRQAFEKYPQHITTIDLNLILELMRKSKKYVECIEFLQKYSDIEFSPRLEDCDFSSRAVLSQALSKRNFVSIPLAFHIELTVKLITCLIHLEAYHLAQTAFSKLSSKSVEQFGDLHLEIAEAYMAKQQWQSSLSITSTLVACPNLKESYLCFLRHAENLYSLKRYAEAAKGYEEVISLAPDHHVAKLNYAWILQKLGRADEALETLEQNQEASAVDHLLIIQKCKICCQEGRIQDLFESMKFLLSRHCHVIRGKEDALALSMAKPDRRHDAVQLARHRRQELISDKRPAFVARKDTLEVEYTLYLQLCRILLRMERYDLLERICYTAWSSEKFPTMPKIEKAIDFQCYIVTLLNYDMKLVGPFVRTQSLDQERIKTTMALNLLNRGVQRHDHVRYGKHLLRVLKKFPNNESLKIILAHHNFACGNYRTALSQYFHVYSRQPKNPIVSIMIVSSLLSTLSQKTMTNRSRLGMQIVAFLQHYMDSRGKCQEIYYNAGRAMHMLGSYPVAIEFYKKALNTPPITHLEKGDIAERIAVETLPWRTNPLDIRHEILFNLAHLYRSTGNGVLARYYLKQIKI